MKKLLFLSLLIFNTFASSEENQDLIEKAIGTIDIALLEQTLSSRPPLSDSEKVQYYELAAEKYNHIKQEFEFEALAEKFGKVQLHSGKLVIGFLGILFSPLVIAYFCVLAPDEHFKKSLFGTLLTYLGMFYCLKKGAIEEGQYEKKRDQDYKNAFKIKHRILNA